jgi:peroxiredoxin
MSRSKDSSASSLSARIASFQEQLAQNLPAPVLQQLIGEIEAMTRQGVGAGAIREGSRAPGFSSLTVEGKRFDLHEALATGPVVLTFFRGAWCPYCDLTLRAYQEVLASVQSLRATLVAVSPQSIEQTLAQIQKSALAFPVIADADNAIARSYGLVYRVSSAMESLLRGFGVELPIVNAVDSWELPVPATYVIDTSGTVRYAFVDADYRKRLEPLELLNQLAGAGSAVTMRTPTAINAIAASS